jgi:hypothetical protein
MADSFAVTQADIDAAWKAYASGLRTVSWGPGRSVTYEDRPALYAAILIMEGRLARSQAGGKRPSRLIPLATSKGIE